MDKLKRLTYDLDDEAPTPEPDQFLVTLTKQRTVSTIYHIAEVRQVKTKDGSRRYSLGVYTANDLKPHTVVTDDKITVKGETAFQLTWYPRGPVAPRFHPNEVNERQIFGDFLEMQTAGAACLLVLLDGQVYRFGQWAGLDGIQHVLGWCRFVDEPAYDALVASARPTWRLPVPLAAGYKEPPSNCTAQVIITTFQAQVQHDAALLYYYNPEWEFAGWMAYQKHALGWAQGLNEEAKGQVQALWHNHRVGAYGLPADPYGLNPATYHEVIARIEFEQNEGVRLEAENPRNSAKERRQLKKRVRVD